MFFNVLTLLTALAISGVAIFYSVAGLAAIFAASVIPVIIMGGVLEVGKLVTAVWLHRNWRTARAYLKYYLAAAVGVLMFITSMGIFGYLSKSHVEQTAASAESVAQIERISAEIARQQAIIERSTTRIEQYESNTGGVDATRQTQIDKEQERASTAYERVQPAIDAQLRIIEAENEAIAKRVAPYRAQVDSIDTVLADLQTAINEGDIKKAQGLVGTRPDGNYGPNTAKAIERFRTSEEQKRKAALDEISKIEIEPSTAKDNAQAELNRLRASVQKEIESSNALVERLRSQLGQASTADIEALLGKEQAKITKANEQLDTLTQEKAAIEVTTRKLEAEVGPIKYIAEFIYQDNADADLLEKAVTWVIIVIIFVFDPLAVLLLIASQYSFEAAVAKKKKPGPKVEEPKPEEVKIRQPGSYNIKFDPLDDYNLELVPIEKPVRQKPDLKIVPKEEPKAEPQAEHKHRETLWPSEIKDLSDEIEIKDEWEDEVEYPEEIIPTTVEPAPPIQLTKVGDNYINFNGKVYQVDALMQSHRELKLDLRSEVKYGEGFPGIAHEGMFFIRTDELPTRLYRYNGYKWDLIDKNLLLPSAYSNQYINTLIDKIANSQYNPELLNDLERTHIEKLLTEE